MTTLVEEIVEGILHENGIDPDHPVYEHLYDKVEGLQELSYELVMEHIHGEQIDELSSGKLRSYMRGAEKSIADANTADKKENGEDYGHYGTKYHRTRAKRWDGIDKATGRLINRHVGSAGTRAIKRNKDSDRPVLGRETRGVYRPS